MMRRHAALIAAALWWMTLAAAPSPHARDDYANTAFTARVRAGLHEFFTRDFSNAHVDFARALAIVPDNTLALAFLNATLMQEPHGLDGLIDDEEAAVVAHPRDALAHVRLGFSYLFAAQESSERTGDAREEFDTAVAIAPDAPAAHVGLGIMREDERSRTRAKLELLSALHADPTDVLAREYLALIYQDDLRDPQRALSLVIDIPNVLPEYADIDYHIASLLDDLHEPDGAIHYATRGLEMDVGHVGEAGKHGYTLLAHIYINEHRFADARRVLKASIAADTDTMLAQTLLTKLDRGDVAGAPSPIPTRAP